MADRSQYAYNYYLQRGYSPAAAAGITGNLMVESGNFSDDVISGKRRGDSGSAAYAPQLRGERLANYYQYANSQGLSPNSLDTQLGFVDHEMRTGLDGGAGVAFKKLQQAPDAATAAQAFMQHYERPNADPNINHIGTRINNASGLMGGQPLSPEQMAAYQQQGIAALQQQGVANTANGAAAALPTLTSAEGGIAGIGAAGPVAASAADPMAGIFGELMKARIQQAQPVAAAPMARQKPVDNRSEEEKMASVSQTPDAYMKRRIS